jgi:hypothetical protein
MPSSITRTGLQALATAVVTKITYSQSADPLQVEVLLNEVENLPGLDQVERSGLLVARTHLHFGRVDAAAFKVRDVLSRLVLRGGGSPEA